MTAMARRPESAINGTPLSEVLEREQRRSRLRFRGRAKWATLNVLAWLLVLIVAGGFVWWVNQSSLPVWAKLVLSLLVSGAGVGGVLFEEDSSSEDFSPHT